MNIDSLKGRSDLFDAYVVKPFHQNQVLEAVAKALGRRAARAGEREEAA